MEITQNETLVLTRVHWGIDSTPIEDREYHLVDSDGTFSPVGTREEWIEYVGARLKSFKWIQFKEQDGSYFGIQVDGLGREWGAKDEI